MGITSGSAVDQKELKAADETTQPADAITDQNDKTDCGEDTFDDNAVAEADNEDGDDDRAVSSEADTTPSPKRRPKWSRVAAFGLLPVLALAAAAGVGYLKWQDAWDRGAGVAGVESLAAAKDSTVAILSYQPDTAEKDLGAARDRLTGKFKDAYTQLTHDVVVPGAKKEHISAVATVPAAALVSAAPDHAVVLVYVNQTVTAGNDVPTDTSSTVRVTLDKSGDRWLISSFDPL
ncbi:hypothetical protein [Mycobacterium sp. MUNTM1]